MSTLAASRLQFALSASGYVMTLFILGWGFSTGKFSIPGADALVWDRVGDEVRAGVSPYYTVDGPGGFYYAPPWAVLFALVSWLPVQITALGIIAAEIASLRYVAGSWLRVGHLCWLPLVAFELPSSQVNLIMAAAIAAAVRGDPRAALVMSAAKLSPVLAIRENWPLAIPVGIVLIAITLPVLPLWLGWFQQLANSYGANIAPGAQIAIPFVPRLAVALILAATGRWWARVLAATIATPAIYWVSAVMLLALNPRPPRVAPELEAKR